MICDDLPVDSSRLIIPRAARRRPFAIIASELLQVRLLAVVRLFVVESLS